MKFPWFAVAAAILVSASGCQCCRLFNCYACAIDDISDTHLYFDRLYCPRLDVSRMGKPDWCGPINNRFCPCACNNGCYDRYDDCHQYPPLYPYELPSYVMPEPTYRTSRIQPNAERDDMQFPSQRRGTPAQTPAPTPAPRPPEDE